MTDDADLQSDSPLTSPEEDRLGYSSFANNLADTLLKRTPSDGYTIGINGEWGSGKSTILNFIEYHLESHQQSPVVVHYNPWWFSDEADLIEKYLNELAAELGTQGHKEIKNTLSDYANHLSKIPWTAMGATGLGKIFGGASKILKEEDVGVSELKQQISNDLEELDRRIIVVIDDIDRLTPSEISQMFRTISSIANFPNITYLLAFDREIISKALQNEQNGINGSKYIQKIIQLPIQIPTPKEGALRGLLEDELGRVKAGYDIEESRWNSLLQHGVMPILDTPRDVIRLSNTVEVMSTSMGQDANFVDIVGLETLRVFYRDLYESIRGKPSDFVGVNTAYVAFDDGSTHSYDEYIPDIQDDKKKEAVKSILMELFPIAEAKLKNTGIAGLNSRELRKKNRICTSERFNVYFRLEIPSDELSSTKMETMISLANDRSRFTGELRKLIEESNPNEKSKALLFIRRLRDYTEEISTNQAVTILNAIFELSKDFENHLPSHRSDEAFRLIRNATGCLLHIIDEHERNEILLQAIEEGSKPGISANVLHVYDPETDIGKGTIINEESLIDEDDFDDMSDKAVEIIKKASEEGNLIDSPWLGQTLEFWCRHGNESDVDSWVESAVETEDGLLKFIDSLFEYMNYNITSPEKSETKSIKYIDPEWVSEYIDESDVKSRLEDIERENLDSEQKETVEKFEYGIEILEAGKNPDSRELWEKYDRDVEPKLD